MRDLMRLPLSPPSSSPSSPPPRRRYSAGTNVDSGSTTPSNPNLKSSGDSVLTFTVFSFGGQSSAREPPGALMIVVDYEHSKPLVVHFLPTSAASSIIPDITKSYASLPQDQITQQRLDSDIKGMQIPVRQVGVDGGRRCITLHFGSISPHYSPFFTFTLLESHLTSPTTRATRVSLLAITDNGNIVCLQGDLRRV
jgi:hypothetical protein